MFKDIIQPLGIGRNPPALIAKAMGHIIQLKAFHGYARRLNRIRICKELRYDRFHGSTP